MSAASRFSAFSITDPLPTGTTLLEASAGTGKTWTIGALVTRYVASGAALLPQLLVITFGRAASQEMRERVRDQLVEAEVALAAPSRHRDGANPLLRWLTDVDDTEADARRARLRAAIADFDGATIATTHQFCQTVLRSLGTAGDSDAGSELVDDVTDLIDQIVDDLYVAKYSRQSDPELGHDEARALAHAVVADPHATLVPTDVDPASPAAVRVRFARAVRERLDERKRTLGLLDYDDLLSRLEAALEPADSPAREFMRNRWKVVLVDEFQDTDPVQWNVLDRAFRGVATLVLIGDPKQAIYAFRGGDVFTYLTAAGTATDRRTLTTNWRSDGPVVEALRATMGGAELGHPDIVVHDVTAHHLASRLSDLPHPGPFRLRVLSRADFTPTRKEIPIGQARARIAEDLAGDIAELLASGARFDPGEGAERPVAAGDVAVLVATGAEADLVRATFARHGIPAVLGGGSNVLTSPAADDWLTLLDAMESPARAPLVRAAAMTDFFGHDAADLGVNGDAVTDAVSGSIRRLAELAETGGVAAVIEAVTDDDFAGRVLNRPDGPRRMTDLRHVAHLMHATATRDRLGLAGLVHWLRRQRSERSESAELTRRLDSDAKAVQVLTVHTSKGLEFPIVYLPFLFNRYVRDAERPRFHDGVGGRFLDVGRRHPGFSEHVHRARTEDAGEVLRLAYVALTRAKSQIVAWWAPTRDARNGGLHQLLFPAGPAGPTVPDDDTAWQLLSALHDRGGPVLERPGPRITVERPVVADDVDLGVRRFDRQVDTAWRRTSYSGLVRVLDHQPHVATEAVDTGTTDEDDLEPIATAMDGTGPADGLASPMADLPTGAAFGSLVHGVLEHVDTTVDDLHAELVSRVESERAYWPVDVEPAAAAAALAEVLSTPLGPLAGDLDLRSLLRDRQLKELDFELPLGGGDTAVVGSHRLGDLADLLDHHLAADDPIRPFAGALRSPALAAQPLRGYLSGSIDLLLRLPDDRYLVVDHKTNWLGRFDQPLTLAGYRPDALATAMNSGTYPLQALLYSVVAHRFCRWRIVDYDPDRHLGGVLYLYVRGMAGPDVPRVDGVPYGVFSWRPPSSLVLALSDLLDGGVA